MSDNPSIIGGVVIPLVALYYSFKYAKLVFDVLTRDGLRSLTHPSPWFMLIFPIHIFLPIVILVISALLAVISDLFSTTTGGFINTAHPDLVLIMAAPLFVFVGGHWIAAAMFSRISILHMVANFSWWFIVTAVGIYVFSDRPFD